MPTQSPSPDESRTFTFEDRHWRVQGLRRQGAGQRLRVTLGGTRGERVHLDTLELYSARSRRAFVTEAAAELTLEPATVKYVVAYRTGPGNQRAYQLIYDDQLSTGAPLRLGRTNAEQLRHQDTRKDSSRSPQTRDS